MTDVLEVKRYIPARTMQPAHASLWLRTEVEQ